MAVSSRIIENAEEYCSLEPHEPFRIEVQDLLKKNDMDELTKRFQKRISFGTAGLRGFMGGGYAFMNDLIVLQASQVRTFFFRKLRKDFFQKRFPNKPGKQKLTVLFGRDKN